ncbi:MULTISPECIES: ROK family transcriptional regulator [unclassified Devosia]|jgi:predicted NBD/HSP70 family sugar kinase|uniref:ROK family transcriptional regulator n=1 Tax=unclassified Devosia TaxID=196773 RepID=UPI000FD8C4E3|nr:MULTISPECIES: ROK family transcriptional regulator [unclassified Devosia]
MHPSVVRQIHASRIFHAIRLNPNASQREIADKAETDKSTVSAILKDFEAIGLIERATKVAGKGRGRPGERISISANGGLLVGVHPVPGEISYVVTGLDGAPLGQVTRTLPHRSELAAELRAGIGELVASIGRSMNEVRAVGVSVPGLVGRDGHLAHSPNLGWRDLELRSLLDNAVEASLYIDNNCNADAMAEYLFGSAAEDETFIYLDSSSGVGAGLFLDGALFRGHGGYAGEFGHTKIVPNGRLCRCGNTGCLSAYVSDFALAQRLQQDGVQVSSTAELLNLAEAGNELALHVLAEMGSYLGIGVSNLINIFDPPRVILGGSLARLAPFIRNSMIHAVEELALPAALQDCRIEFSSLSTNNVPLGGVALALEGCTNFSGAKAPLWHAPSAADPSAAESAAS